MNILIVTARFYPETFAINRIAEGFVSAGHNVTVLTGVPHYGQKKVYDGYEGIYEQTINKIKIIRIKEHIRSDDSTKSLFLNYLSIFNKFPKKLKKIKGDFDIVISHVLSPIFSMRGIDKYCKKHKIPHLHYCLDLWPESLVATRYFSRRSPLFKLMKWYSQKIYSSIDEIIIYSPSQVSYFYEYLKLPKLKLKHIYQPTYAQAPSILETMEHQYKGDGILKILFAGSIVKFNRMELMMEAISLCKEKKNVEYHVLGSGSEEEHMRQIAKDLNLSNVYFHGRVPVEETKEYLLNADVLFIPLAFNSKTSLMIPQKVTESLMFGRPVLGMLKGDGRDILLNASSGNVLVEETKESLANAIDYLSNIDSNKLSKTGKENRVFFDKELRFQFDVIFKEFLNEVNFLVEANKK